MKANLKGLQGAKGFLLKHCEKVAAAVVAICALIFIIKSVGREQLPAENQPERLNELVDQARNKVTDFDWDDAPEDERSTRVAFLDQASHMVDPKIYRTSPSGINPSVVEPTVLRTDPLLLAPLELEVNVGTGLLAYVDENVRRQRQLEAAREQEERERERRERREQRNDEDPYGRGQRGEEGGRGAGYDPEHPNRRRVTGRVRPAGVPTQGDERIERAHWATVVAKVPIEDQITMYRDALEEAKNYRPGSDCPEFRGYFVERAEVVPGKQLQWKSLFTGADPTIDKMIEDWPAAQPEVVDNPYFHPLLTFPLPPLVGRDWQYNATHSEIPLAADVVDVEPEEEEPEPAEEEGTQDLFAGNDDPNRHGGIGGRGQYGMEYGSEMGGYGMEYGGEMSEYGGGRGNYGGEYGGEMGNYGSYGTEYGGEMEMGGRGGRGTRSRGTRGVSTAICSAEEPYLLFRFFDFTVQPGKRYQYRVRFVFGDVNQRISYSALDNSVIERLQAEGDKPKGYRLSDWSDPSPVAQIPLGGGSVRTVEAKPPVQRARNSEPEVTLLVQAFGVGEDGKPIQAAEEKQLRPGGVANMTEDAEVLVENGRAIDEIDSFKFHTDIAVLDIQGGDRLGRDLSVPGRVLLMDSAGQLYIRDELDDLADVEEHESIFAEEDNNRGRGAYENYGGEGGGAFEQMR